MASLNQSTDHPEEEKNKTDVKKEEDEEQKKREAERAKRLQVRKVSPVKQFFSSIRVKFFCVIIFFTLLAAVAVSVAASLLILDFYEDMDTLDMKNRVQNAVIGLQRGGNTLTSRGASVSMNLFSPLTTDSSLITDVEQGEIAMARYLFEDGNMVNYIEGMGPISYSVPFQLIMAWDAGWNERLVYYIPCDKEKGSNHCDFVSREKVFVDYEHGDYHMAHKGKVPYFFRSMKDHPPTQCDMNACLGIATDIPEEEGGPMFYYLGSYMYGSYYSGLAGWHYLIGYSMRLLQQVQANRTGLCVTGFSSTEANLPQFVKDELELKKSKGQVLNPHDYIPGTRTIRQNTDQVTMDQDYYSVSSSTYEEQKLGREYCDASYNHGGDETVSISYAYLAYYGYDLSIGNLSKDNIYMLRFSYHDPMTAEYYPAVQIFIICLVLVWLVSIACMIIYFNHVFLVPLDKMRKLRADFIKNILQGLDDDGVLAQEVFGDMLDDSALIEANGDEISVMLTLQDRVDALYTKVIENRQSDLNRLRNHTQRGNTAMRLMSFFLRRDEDNLRSILPGLLDPNEMARRFRRTNVADAEVSQELISARHAFRSLKAILNNHIATEFFKHYCTQRGRSSVNSFFFLMDVSWLSQVEGAARSENEDFLSTLFAESVPQSPASMSPLNSPRPHTLDENSAMNYSSDLLCGLDHSTSELMPAAPEPDRPHRSHFAKSKDSIGETGGKKIPTVPGAASVGGDSTPSIGSSASNSAANLIGSSGSPLGSPKPGAAQRTQFLTKNGETIAHFIHERYFGRKSLAQTDLKHAALLGCSQVPDYLTLRDKSHIHYSPVMFNSLVAAVTKKFSADVIPQFLNSTTFQMMVYALTLSGYFEKGDKSGFNNARKILLLMQQQSEEETVKETVAGVGFNSPLIRGVWAACRNNRKKEEQSKPADDDSSSSSDSDDGNSDDDDDSDDSEQ